MPRIASLLRRSWRHFSSPLAVLFALTIALALAGNVGAAPSDGTPGATGLPGTVGPVDPTVTHAQGLFHRPVTFAGITVYTNDQGETATGAAPIDAVRGFTPPATGIARGPDFSITPSCIQPPDPAVRDRTTMSDAELESYGLPTHALIHDQAEWLQAVMSVRTRACTGRTLYRDGHMMRNTTLRPGHPAISRMAQAVGNNFVDVPNTFDQGGWSGWGADRFNCTVGTCPKITSTEGYWHIPTALYTGQLNDSMVAWYGVGGYEATDPNCDGGAGLVQVGTMSWHQAGADNVNYDMWVENTTAAPVCGQIEIINSSNSSIFAGQLMHAVVGGGTTHASVYINDQTIGWAYQSNNGSVTPWPTPDQNTAECIVERNHWNGGQALVFLHMADFGSVHFEWCRATTNYTTEAGIGNVANMIPDRFRYYNLSGSPQYCVTVDDFDDTPTIPNSSYFALSNESTYPSC